MDEGSLKRALSLHALQMFTCNALFEAEEITRFGGWRGYLAQRAG